MPPTTSSDRLTEVYSFAEATMATTLGSGRALRSLARDLHGQERLVALGAGLTGERKALVAATTRRVVIIVPSRFGMKLTAIENGAVERVDVGVRLAGSVLTIRTDAGTYLVRGMAHAEAEALRDAMGEPAQAAPEGETGEPRSA